MLPRPIFGFDSILTQSVHCMALFYFRSLLLIHLSQQFINTHNLHAQCK